MERSRYRSQMTIHTRERIRLAGITRSAGGHTLYYSHRPRFEVFKREHGEYSRPCESSKKGILASWGPFRHSYKVTCLDFVESPRIEWCCTHTTRPVRASRHGISILSSLQREVTQLQSQHKRWDWAKQRVSFSLKYYIS